MYCITHPSPCICAGMLIRYMHLLIFVPYIYRVYGAYRRSKIPVSTVKTSTKSGRGKKSDNKKGKAPTTDNDSFYNAIKNLGSGPGAKVRLHVYSMLIIC